MRDINKIANIFGMLLGDGWISANKNNTNQCGFSGDRESLFILKDDLKEIFGDIGKAKIRTYNSHSEKYNINGTTSMFCVKTSICKYFISLDCPIGRRVETPFTIPRWITNGSVEVKRNFISGLYSAEGFTPKMQKNDKTLRPLGLCITKRKRLQSNFTVFLRQLTEILDELKIENNISMVETFTCDENLKATITFNNSLDNIIRCCEVLDLRYCINKKHMLYCVHKYHILKKERLNELNEAYLLAINKTYTAQEISHKYGITKRQVQNWSQGLRKPGLPKTFITFSDFKISLFTINPVNSVEAKLQCNMPISEQSTYRNISVCVTTRE